MSRPGRSSQLVRLTWSSASEQMRGTAPTRETARGVLTEAGRHHCFFLNLILLRNFPELLILGIFHQLGECRLRDSQHVCLKDGDERPLAEGNTISDNVDELLIHRFTNACELRENFLDIT